MAGPQAKRSLFEKRLAARADTKTFIKLEPGFANANGPD
jgi:hypothetical protein